MDSGSDTSAIDKMITIRDLSKIFATRSEKVIALDSVDLEVERGEYVVILGPSGSGKTTLLRCVAGLEKPDSGEVFLDTRCVYSGATNTFVRPEDRRLGMVFQSYAIWPHMNVYDNVALPLRRGRSKIPKDQVRGRVMDVLTEVGMERMADRPVPKLSGGQQQRVALARSLGLRPEILLMDEPLSNLDARLREEVRAEIRQVARRAGVTVLHVTHDQAEAMELADRIVVMHEGHVLQVGTAQDVYHHPVNPEVANSLGAMNWIPGVMGDNGEVKTAYGDLRTNDGPLPAQGPVTIGIRPEFMELAPDAADVRDGDILLRGTVAELTFFGDHYLYRVQVGDQRFSAKVPLPIPLSGEVSIRISSERACIFPGELAVAGENQRDDLP